MKKAASSSRKITSFFSVQPVQIQTSPDENEKIKSAIESLAVTLSPNASSGGPTSVYQHCGLHAVYLYFRYLHSGVGRINASSKAARDIWPNPSQFYRARAIRSWEKTYLDFGYLSAHRQGAHAKRQSVLSHEDIKEKFCLWISQQKAERRFIPMMLKYLNEMVIPEVTGISGNVGEKTLWRYLAEWGYSHKRNSKDVYFDGHDREDVVVYRGEWTKRMMEYKVRMESYDPEDVTMVTEPELASQEKKLVMVTHDESTFYANDGKQSIWVKDGESIIRNKSPGLSIMVSEFQYACHDTMRHNGKTSRTFFYAGVNRPGYWTHVEFSEQLGEVIRIFEALHPDCQALFLFDQSSNHNAYAKDALVVSRMKKNESRCLSNEQFEFRRGYHTLPSTGDSLIPQSMYFNKEENIAKRKRGEDIVTAQKKIVRYNKGITRVALQTLFRLILSCTPQFSINYYSELK
ncbi:hypothetical protein BC941DRAFT_364787 [Chlamydoabsidia padenii]|nr:hypothetical protein BC941DRAFT_364787 [Chlamydoabsidia padenii]